MRFAITLGVVAGLSACRAVPVPGPGDPYAVPYEALSENQKERVNRVMDSPTVMVELERTPVKSRPDLYVFLLDELPFTAGVLRELGEGKYEIWRSNDGGGYLLDDREGLRLRAELVRREEGRWFFYTHGTYHTGLFPVTGHSLIIVRYEEVDGVLVTEARVYAKVEGKVLEGLAKAMRQGVENTIREKSFVFIKAAKMVSEIAARDPAGLCATVRGSEHVDAAVLDEFERRFVRLAPKDQR